MYIIEMSKDPTTQKKNYKLDLQHFLKLFALVEYTTTLMEHPVAF